MDETQTQGSCTAGSSPGDMRTPDFASGRCVGTEVYNDKCVFLDSIGQLLDSARRRRQRAWTAGPGSRSTASSYPIEISEGYREFRSHAAGRAALLHDQPRLRRCPLFRACKDELVHLLGAEGYGRLEEHYRSRDLQKSKVLAIFRVDTRPPDSRRAKAWISFRTRSPCHRRRARDRPGHCQGISSTKALMSRSSTGPSRMISRSSSDVAHGRAGGRSLQKAVDITNAAVDRKGL